MSLIVLTIAQFKLLYSLLVLLIHLFPLFLPHSAIMALKSILYIAAIILFLGWLAGYFWFRGGRLINILLVLSIASVIIGFLRKNEEE